MIFGLNPHAQRTLSTQFQERQTKKMYVARVWGVPEEKMGTVDLPLIVDWPNRPLQMVCHETGKPSVTDWRLLKDQGETARIRLIPKTGRTHQLRLHMMALGYPILGDPFYGHAESQAYPRMMLHSEELRVKHPENGQSLRVRAKPPF
jgi:tRNA pseudouridine32 synthase/23S rRNA pseudouridine746 synthase